MNPAFADELRKLTGRVLSPTIVVDDQIFIGFGLNLNKLLKLFG